MREGDHAGGKPSLETGPLHLTCADGGRLVGWPAGVLVVTHGATGSEGGHVVQARGRTQLAWPGSQKMGWVGVPAAMEASGRGSGALLAQVIRT